MSKDLEAIVLDTCCGSTMSLATVPMEILYGAGPLPATIIAHVPAWVCAECGDITTAEGAELAEHNAVCDYLLRLKPAEIKNLRDEMGLTQNAFALKLRVSRVSLARWEGAVQVQSAGHDAAMRKLLDEFREAKAGQNRFVFRTDVRHRELAASLFDLRAA